MCTYTTTLVEVGGAGKGAAGWFPLTSASVYVDHPVHALPAHTLNVDFRNPERGPSARVAVELDAASARELAHAILHALDTAPPGLLEEPVLSDGGGGQGA